MRGFTLRDALLACGGTYLGDPALLTRELPCVVIDSRLVIAGALFVPIKGDRFDGHSFIPTALAAGALCTLTEHALSPELPQILVDSTLNAFQDIAGAYRRTLNVRVVGVTGSVGKTTTKEFIASVLCERFKTLKTEGNFNNQTGVPQTLFRLEPEDEVAVIEMGTNHFGEIRNLSRITAPEICVITNIGDAHLEFLGSREGILAAKSEMFEYRKANGAILVNGDDALLRRLPAEYSCAQTFGCKEGCDYRAEEITNLGLAGSSFIACFKDKRLPLQIPAPGRHMILNALCALAVADHLGVNEPEIQRGLAAYAPPSGRMHLLSYGSLTVLSDAYNANPTSMAASLETLAYAKSRTVAILGDMFELGDASPALHQKIGRRAAELNITLLIFCGTLSHEGYLAAKATGADALWFETTDELLLSLPSLLRPGDTILVKASHGMALDKVVSFLEAHPV